MKFINLSGKRLMVGQILACKERGITEFVEPEESTRNLLECNKQLQGDEYSEKAKEIISKFGIKKNDYVHINGIDINLVLALSRQLPAHYIYSKMMKKNVNEKYITEFVCFVELL